MTAPYHLNPRLKGQPSKCYPKNEKCIYEIPEEEHLELYSDAINVWVELSGGFPIAPKRKVLAQKSIAAVAPDLALEWHQTKNGSLTPFDFSATSNASLVWWECSTCETEWPAVPQARVNGSGCPSCNGRWAIPGKTDLATAYPEVAKRWHPDNRLGPEHYLPTSHEQVWWGCEVNTSHKVKAGIAGEVRYNQCSICNHRVVIPGENDFLTEFPYLEKEWSSKNVLNPHLLSYGSVQRVIWDCGQCGHEWPACIKSRTSGTGCPTCSSKFSPLEEELQEWVRSQISEVETHTRKYLRGPKGLPWEIDLYIPSLRVAVEFNGDGWHSDYYTFKRRGMSSKDHHELKWELAHAQGINMLYVWRSDWARQKSEVKEALLEVLSRRATTTPAILAIMTKQVDS